MEEIAMIFFFGMNILKFMIYLIILMILKMKIFFNEDTKKKLIFF